MKQYVSEREFIINLAINAFNLQYSRNINPKECDAYSIPKNKTSRMAYEVYTLRTDDAVRMRIYLNFGKHDGLSPFRLETDNQNIVNALGDEVYVSSGYVDKFYYDNRIYKFSTMEQDPSAMNIITSLTGTPFVTFEGEYINIMTN